MIEFRNVELHYHYDEYAVIKNLNFTLADGVNTILCDSQSGKTSVCKLLTKQFKPTNGHIYIDEKDILSIDNQSLGILYMPAKPTFFENRSVEYNITYPLKIREICKEERLRRLVKVAAAVELTSLKSKVRKLNEAERKRVAIARGLTVQRQIVLLDDFCETEEQVQEILNLFGNITVVFFTSDISLARGNVVVLDGGINVYQGDVVGAKAVRENLSWIVDLLRRE